MSDTGTGSKNVFIIGGGITGLTAAYRLTSLNAQINVTLIESRDRTGGTIRTVRKAPIVMECGPDSFFTARPEALDLCRELGLEEELIETNKVGRRALIARGKQLMPLPDGFVLLSPSSFLPILSSPLLSIPGRIRCMLEPLIPGRISRSDESVADFVRRRFGKEMVEAIAQPMVGGIYVGDVEKLSAGSVLSQFVEYEQRYGSVVLGLKNKRDDDGNQDSGARYSMFLSLKDGMGSLIDRLVERIGKSHIITGRCVKSLRRSGDSWRLLLEGSDSELEADAVICCASPTDVSPLVSSVDHRLSKLLQIPCASSAVVNLVYERGQFLSEPSGFGFVVPRTEKSSILACSFNSIKFAGRCPDEMIVVRAFVGGMLQSSLLDKPDEEICELAHLAVCEYLKLVGEPTNTMVSRWNNSMPQYLVGHQSIIDEIDERLERLPGLLLAGNYLAGVGIPDCVRSAESAAAKARSYLNSAPV